jgi:peptidoglycan hydrolase-like protein with peptidoglycan-binding domain
MDRTITASVGEGGANRPADVRTVQEMLNKALPGWGGPTPKLVVDGACGPLTKTAIRRFQQVQLATYFPPDGRVDPGHRTLKRLNHIWNVNDPPTGAVNISAEPIDHTRQPTNMTCWAAAGTMLVAARDRVCKPIEAVMRVADANDPGYVPAPGVNGYLALFRGNGGLPPADTGRYTRSLGLRVGPAACFPVRGWVQLMTRNGAIGVVGLSPFLHIRVITEMKGDGSVFGTFFTVHDPGRAAPYTEAFITFTERYEAAATVNDRMDQIWHK